MKVAVIGSSGGMGAFFVRYFLDKRFQVAGWDVALGGRASRPRGLVFSRSGPDACRGADAVVIATPIHLTVEVAESVAPHMARGTGLVEISSVKRGILPALRKTAASRGLVLVSLHPLFGPSLGSFRAMKLALIEGDAASSRLAKRLFPGVRLVRVAEEEHERVMGLVLAMTHLLNLAYAGVVARHMPAKRFRELATPTSSVQLTLAEGVLSQNPDLYSYIQLENEYAQVFAGELAKELGELRDVVARRDAEEFNKRYEELSRALSTDTSAETMEKVYRVFEASAPG